MIAGASSVLAADAPATASATSTKPEATPVANGMTVEQALAALKVHEEKDTFGDAKAWEAINMVNEHFAKDPVVIAFFRDALTTRPDEACSDLQCMRKVWDGSFVEPMLKIVDTNAEAIAHSSGVGVRGYSPTLPAIKEPINIFEDAIDVFAAHYTSWGKDLTIAPHLSKAVFVAYPDLIGTTIGGITAHGVIELPRMELYLLAETHDPAMLGVLQTFLSDKAPDRWEISVRRTPARTCDIAANAINYFLGERELFEFMDSGIGVTSVGHYAEWDEWDKQIAYLQKYLDALEKLNNSPPSVK